MAVGHIHKNATSDVQQQRQGFHLYSLSLNYRRKKAPTNVEAFLHHSLLQRITYVNDGTRGRT